MITDARFSGVSTGACIGHVTPEALAGGPIGKVRDGDQIEIVDRPRAADGRGQPGGEWQRGGRRRANWQRDPCPPDLVADPDLPPDTRLWAALQDVSGGTWGGCVFDVERIVERLKS